MVAQALWHLNLEAGAEVPMLVRRDFQITNASLTEVIGDAKDRTVIQMAFQPVNPSDFDSDDDEDSEDDLSEADLMSDEDDDEEIKQLKKELLASAAANEEEDEEEMDGDDDEGSEFSISEEPVDVVICALTPGKIEQVQLNLIYNRDEVVVFKNLGKNDVCLLGNYINQMPYDYNPGESDEEEDEEEYFDSDDAEEEFDIDMADMEKLVGKKGKSAIEEVAEPTTKKADKKPKSAEAAAVPESKKRKAEEAAKPSEKKQKTEVAAETPAVAAAEKKKAKKEAAAKPEATSSKKTTLPNGMIIEDVKVGDGAVAKKGKRCGMRYIGKLLNGKQFDANTAGAPFNFRLGAGEVIKGWDVGVAGMAVGGERKLTIPAALAYGAQKIPGIPANSTLTFDIKLVNVK